MTSADSTCWTVIEGAAAGRSEDREEFARRYLPIVRAFLGARWRSTPFLPEVDDAVQEVFLDCARRNGPLERVDPSRPGGFRAFLYGVVRNVALRTEEATAKRLRERASTDGDVLVTALDPSEPAEARFDREWATALIREAADLQAQRAATKGPPAVARADLLRLRFGEGLPVREIARRQGLDPARLHHDVSQAKEEFRAALTEVLHFHSEDSTSFVRVTADRLLDAFD